MHFEVAQQWMTVLGFEACQSSSSICDFNSIDLLSVVILVGRANIRNLFSWVLIALLDIRSANFSLSVLPAKSLVLFMLW